MAEQLETWEQILDNLLDLMIDSVIENTGYSDPNQRQALLNHLQVVYNSPEAEEWRQLGEAIEALMDEMETSAAAFVDGWSQARKQQIVEAPSTESI